MIVDSYCRQESWGSWDGGYYVAGETSLPGPDAEWPTRTAIETTCPYLPLPVPTGDGIEDAKQADRRGP